MSNKAAWSTVQGGPIKIDDAPIPQAEPGHVVVKNAAIAINPADWKMHDFGWFVNEWPTILGCDVAGEVYSVGEGVTGFEKGQRVAGNCCRLITGRNEEAGFQLYTLVVASLLAPIPDDISFEDAVVVPLSITTAVAGLYAEDKLAVPLPTASPEKNGKTILIWGGSSSVGCSTIQLANASGLEVIATSSEHNFSLLKSLGAAATYDYRNSNIIDSLVEDLKGKDVVGCFDCIGTPDTTKACTKILSALGESFIASVSPLENLPSNVKGAQVLAETIKDTQIAKAIFKDYLPSALQRKRFRPAPKPEIVGSGLEAVEAGFNQLRGGVSGVKLVVRI